MLPHGGGSGAIGRAAENIFVFKRICRICFEDQADAGHTWTPRIGLKKECELCNNAEWRPGVSCAVPARDSVDAGVDSQTEDLVQAITDQIMSKLNTR